ncbi:MAG: hypothetical protein ACRCSE_09940 [Vibrio sp.]
MKPMTISVLRDDLVEALKAESFPVDQIPSFLAVFDECQIDGNCWVQIDFGRAMLSNLNYSVQKLTSHLFLLGWWCFWVAVFNCTTHGRDYFQAAGAIRSLTFLASCTSDRKLAQRMAEWWEECMPIIGAELEGF